MKDDFHKQISVDVGAAIREQRLAAGLSQDQLAEALDVGPEAVSRMERGVVSPTCRIPDDHKDAYETGLAENRTSPS